MPEKIIAKELNFPCPVCGGILSYTERDASVKMHDHVICLGPCFLEVSDDQTGGALKYFKAPVNRFAIQHVYKGEWNDEEYSNYYFNTTLSFAEVKERFLEIIAILPISVDTSEGETVMLINPQSFEIDDKLKEI